MGDEEIKAQKRRVLRTPLFKSSWKGCDRTCHFTGPFTFLVIFYASSTLAEGEKIKMIQPLILGWTTEDLKQRQAYEEKKKGFGKVKLVDGLKDTRRRRKVLATSISSNVIPIAGLMSSGTSGNQKGTPSGETCITPTEFGNFSLSV